MRTRAHCWQWMLLAVLALACRPGQSPTGAQDDAPQTRLNPLTMTTIPTRALAALVDGDPSTSVEITSPVVVTLTFAHDIDARALKVFGVQGVRLSADGLDEVELASEPSWDRHTIATTGKRTTLTLKLEPSGAGGRLAELEIWGVGPGSAPRDPRAFAEASHNAGLTLPYDNARLFPGTPADLSLHPDGMNEGDSCGSIRVSFATPLATVHRAFLAYEATGVQRGIVLQRSLDAAAPVGGFWLGGGGTEHTVVDELDPARLTGRDEVRLCLPREASQAVSVKNARLLLELNDGTNLLDRDSQAVLAEAFDGRLDTSTNIATGRTELTFGRAVSLDAAALHLETPAARGGARTMTERREWIDAGPLDLSQGWNELTLPGNKLGGFSVDLTSVPRPDVPAASIAEVALAGSPSGRGPLGPNLVITYPALTFKAGRFVGERFGDRAFLAGWAESPAGPGDVEVEGAPVGNGDGTFSTPLLRPSDESQANQPWKVTVRARFPDGTTLLRELELSDERENELQGEGQAAGLAGDEAQRYGQENQTAWGRVDAAKGGVVRLGSQVAFEASPGAVDDAVNVGITHKRPEAVPPLDPGMVNVTAPANAGYRFSPPGQVFKAPVKITLPYDESLLPEGIPAEEIQTFYYDPSAERWQPLPRNQVNRATSQIVSETTHFTFMINAVLVLPDHPGPASFNPTALKDLKAADPSAGIDFIEAPSPNNQGTAHVSYPLRLPPGRGAYKPSLALTYDSSAGNDWVGVGWQLHVSSINVDTRFGAPFYDGSERYELDGQQLVPIGDGPCLAGGTNAKGTRYAARVEGAFNQIVRCGTSSRDYHFEVVDRGGTLYAYGITESARVASPRSGDIAQWNLERVVDPNGNVTRFVYELDQLKPGYSAFDGQNHEDFRQSYLTEIHYTGKGQRLGSAALEAGADDESGAYAVVFEREMTGGKLANRPDIITSARSGFKVVTRHRLASVQIWLTQGPAEQTGIIREYKLAYEPGDFGKSRLSSVEMFGRGGITGGRSFYSHRLSYTTAQKGFSSPVAWNFEGSEDANGISASDEQSVGVHAFAGISAGPERSAGSVGLSVGYNHRETTTRATLLDINGDGLPDRLSMNSSGSVAVQFNQSRSLSDGSVRYALSGTAPPGDPFAGGIPAPIAVPSKASLGHESGDALNFGIQAMFGPIAANVGGSQNWTSSSDFLQDVDGDGLPDLVGQGQVLFNQPRGCTGPGCSPAGEFRFGTDKPVRASISLANVANSGSALTSDPELLAAQQRANAHSTPTDALLEWTAPFDGTVDLLGAMAWVRSAPAGSGHDGVRLRVYHAHPDGSMDTSAPLMEVVKSAGSSQTSIAQRGIQVAHQDRLYFVLSTLSDFPVDTTSQPPHPLEEVSFSPVLRYTACTGACGGLSAADASLVDPTGAPLFTFDANTDFKLAGGPFSAVRVGYTGTLHISGTVNKSSTADDAVACVQKIPRTATTTPDIRCGMSTSDVQQLGSVQLGADSTSGAPLSLDIEVAADDSLVFRVDTDLAIDPGAIKWTPHGEMTRICDAAGNCRAPRSSELSSVSFDADPYIPTHERLDPTPLRPLVVPRSGTLHYQSSAPLAPQWITFSARGNGKLYFKHAGGQSRSGTLQVNAGDQILFEAHSEYAQLGVPWPLSVWYEDSTADGGVQRQDLSPVAHVTFDHLGTQDGVPVPTPSPFGGGFHGWRYGLWGGTSSDAFDPTIFFSRANIQFNGTNREKYLDAKSQMRDPNSELSRRSRLFAPLLPRFNGTKTQSDGSPGLAPKPAFVSQDGTCFITNETMHGGRKGGYTAVAGQTSPLQALFRLGDMKRASEGHTLSAGLSFEDIGLSVSTGGSTEKTDVRDMNGDGIVDVAVAGNGVQLTHLNQLTPRPAPSNGAPPLVLQQSSDLSASLGLGISEPFRDLKSSGLPKGQTAMFPSSIGGGLGASLSAVAQELVDFNGDGLPDQVRMDRAKHPGVFLVRLNLGTSFAEQEDEVPVGTWGAGTDWDPFVKRVRSQVSGFAPEGGMDDEEAQGQLDTLGVLDKLATPDVVKRTTAVTLELNGGFVLDEEWGVTLNQETSVNGTHVMLVDVTGDGLPDYVRKSTDGSFKVRVNHGYGFGPEVEDWKVVDWPVKKPRLRLPTAPLQDWVNTFGLANGADTVEASGTVSAVPSVGFAATVPIWVLGPWLILSGGGDASLHKVSGFELGLMDIDGDGLADHVLKTEEDSEDGSTASNRQAIYARLNQNGGGNLLAKVEQPLGGSFELSYVRAGNMVDMPESRYVLSSVFVHDGLRSGTGHDFTTFVRYQDGHHDRAEREFLGFASVEELRGDGSTVTQRYLTSDYAHKGLLASEELRDANGKLFIATLNSYDQTPQVVAPPVQSCVDFTPFFLSPADYCTAAWVRLNRTEHRSYEGLSQDVDQPRPTTAQEFHYDPATGNVTGFDDFGDMADPSDDLSGSVAYLTGGAAASLHAIDRPTHVEIRAGRLGTSGALLRERNATFDDRGNLLQLATTLTSGSAAVADLQWTDDGNLQQFLGPPNVNGQRYALTYTYDPTTRTFPASVTDSFGYTSSTEYDLGLGEVLRTTDTAGNPMYRRFDAFGRLVDLLGPYDSPGTGHPTVHIDYGHDQKPAWAWTRNKLPEPKSDGSTTLDTVVFLDGLRRAIQTKTDADLSGQLGTTVSGRLDFDAMGRVISQGQAFFSTLDKTTFVAPGEARNPTTFTYDVLGRTLSEVAPDHSTTWSEYGFGVPASGSSITHFRTAVTDAENHVHVSYLDGEGRLTAIEERLDGRALTTRYAYNPMDEVESIIDAAGNTTSMAYDLAGRRTSVTTPDAGRTEFFYDRAGNVVEKIDPNLRAAHLSLQYRYTYNRLERIIRPYSGDITFEYGAMGAPENAAGRLTRIVDEAGEETRGYGKLGELIRSTRVVRPLKPGDRPRTFETRFGSDSFGRMLSIQYPDGELLRYGYDGAGLLKSAIGYRPATDRQPAETETYLSEMDYDEFGSRTRMVLGNGVVTRYAYNAQTRRLEHLNTVTPSNRVIQALTYTYDRVGNITDIVNALAPAEGRRSGPVTLHYGYDALDRLIAAQGTAQARQGLVDRFYSRFEYSDIHNMTRNVQVRELVSTTSLDPDVEHPEKSNHDYTYVYQGAGPHQATQIGDMAFTYDANGNVLIQCRPGQGICASTAPPPGQSGAPASHDHYRSLSWTEENWLRAVVDGGGQNVTRFLYDSSGQRVAKLGHGGASLTIGQFFSLQDKHHATKHIFAGNVRLASKLLPVSDQAQTSDGGGQVDPGTLPGCEPSDYQPKKCPPVAGGGGPVASGGIGRIKPATYYYHPDHLGSTSWMTDQSGRVHEHVEYFPYGEVWRETRGDTDPGPKPRTPSYLFTGKEYDEETGLTYFGFRYYDSRFALWLSCDPALPGIALRDPSTLSAYRYGHHNPLRYVDPDGADDEDEGVRQAMQLHGRQMEQVRKTFQEVKPYAEAAAQLNPAIAASVAISGEQATGGKASTGERVMAGAGSFGRVLGSGAKLLGKGIGKLFGASKVEATAVELGEAAVTEGKLAEATTAANTEQKLLQQGYRLFKGDEAIIHFNKHAGEIMEALGKKSYNLAEYIDDANHVVSSGTWVPELNAYVKPIGGLGSAKAAFVGLDRATGNITTFHIKSIKELAQKAPSLGWTP